MASLNVVFVIGVIAFFGLLAVGAIAAFVYSVIQQRQYDTTSLPDLGYDAPEEEAPIFAEEEDEVVTESRFEQSQEELVLEDEETNQLMKSLNKATGESEGQAKPSVIAGLFKSNKTLDKGKEGEANADSQ